MSPTRRFVKHFFVGKKLPDSTYALDAFLICRGRSTRKAAWAVGQAITLLPEAQQQAVIALLCQFAQEGE